MFSRLRNPVLGALLGFAPALIALVIAGISGRLSWTWVVLIGALGVAGALWASNRFRETQIRREVTVDTGIVSALLNALPSPMMILDDRRRVIEANEAAVEQWGENLLGRDLAASLRHPDILDAVNAVLEGEPRRRTQLTLPVPVHQVFEVHAAHLPPRERDPVRAVVVLHDITALKGAEKMRVDFVANVSHELRSPLSSLTGFIETLQGPASDDPQAQQKFLKIMESEANRMSRLIGDLLSLSKVEENEHIRPEGETDIKPVLTSIIQSLSKRARERGAEIVLNCPDDVPAVNGDKDELTEVFHNLVDNAVKYGGKGRPVTIDVELQSSQSGRTMVKISITDEGEGIEPEHIPRLTERFYRVDKGRSRSMGGTGLGLAIVKHIVNRHRGRLVIDSVVGEGSRFSVYLPVVREAAKKTEVSQASRAS